MYKRAIVLFLAYLMWSENLYNDELSQMSLIMSNLAHNETIILKEKRKNYGTMNIKQYMEKLGFKYVDNHEVYNDDNVRVNCYIGYKSIDYYEKKRGVIGVFLNTNESVEAYKKLAVDLDYLRDNNLYEQIAENVYNKIDINKLMNIESEYSLDYCYFISGKGLAGGIASEIAHIIRHEKDTDKDIYCYTFGAPKTHIGVDYIDSFIKNIINEDDYLTKVIPDENGYRNGYTYNASVYSDFIYNYKNLTRNNPKYTGNYMNMNTLNNYVWILYSQIPTIAEGIKEDIAKLLSKHIGRSNNDEDFSNTLNYNGSYLVGIQMKKQISNKEIETASSTKAYWTLAKVLEGLDEKTINQRSYKKTKQEADSEKWDYKEKRDILETIKALGVWYVNHITTYQTDLRESRGTTVAKDYYDDNIKENTYPMDGSERLSDKDSETIIKKGSTKYYYFYAPFAGFETSNDESYKNDGTNRNYLKRYLGDDCSGLVQGLIYTLSEGNRGQERSNPNIQTDTTGLWNHNVNADKLVSDTTYDTENSMMRLGWEKYYVQGNEWKRKRMKYDGTIENKTLKEIYNNLDYTMSSDFLEPGDILCSNSHVEFYVGYNYDVTYNDEDTGRTSGIASIEIGNKANQGYSTFAWGNVQNEFPKQNYYFTYDSANRVFRLNYSSASSDGKSYKVIWRKN